MTDTEAGLEDLLVSKYRKRAFASQAKDRGIDSRSESMTQDCLSPSRVAKIFQQENI